MKKFVFILMVVTILLTIPTPATAYAEVADEYYLVTSKSAPLIESADETGFVIFQIIKGCYAKKLGEPVGAFAHVSYMGIEGYIPLSYLDSDTVSDLVFTGTEYYHETITFYLSSGTVLTAEPGGRRALTGVDTQMEFTLLGVALSGGREYVCTKYGPGALDYGYAPVTGTTWMPTINQITAPTVYVPPEPVLPDPSPLPDEPTLSPTVTTDSNDEIVRLLLVIGICVPVVIVLVLIFKPVKAPYDHYGFDSSTKGRYENFEDVDS